MFSRRANHKTCHWKHLRMLSLGDAAQGIFPVKSILTQFSSLCGVHCLICGLFWSNAALKIHTFWKTDTRFYLKYIRLALSEEAKAFAISSSSVKNYATYTHYYYIDNSVSVENRPLVKFMRNDIRDSSGVFSISSLVRTSMTSFPAFTLLFVQKYSCLHNKKRGWVKYCFLPRKNKIHTFKPPCNILYIERDYESYIKSIYKGCGKKYKGAKIKITKNYKLLKTEWF